MNTLRVALISAVFSIASLTAFATSHVPIAPMTDGEIRKVDKDTNKLTIKHGPIQNLEMPAMTMVFQTKDASVLDQVKAGDKVKFTVEKIGGAMVVTHIEAVK
jgi:Cu/Ag efflux protein CusF